MVKISRVRTGNSNDLCPLILKTILFERFDAERYTFICLQKQGYCYQICVPDTCTRSTLTPSHHWVMRPWHKTCHKQRMPTLDMWGNVSHVDIFDDKQYRKIISFYEIKCFYSSALSISIS